VLRPLQLQMQLPLLLLPQNPRWQLLQLLPKQILLLQQRPLQLLLQQL
jgi:hypothetical protein